MVSWRGRPPRRGQAADTAMPVARTAHRKQLSWLLLLGSRLSSGSQLECRIDGSVRRSAHKDRGSSRSRDCFRAIHLFHGGYKPWLLTHAVKRRVTLEINDEITALVYQFFNPVQSRFHSP